MALARRVVRYLLLGLGGLIVAVLALVLVFTRTGFGVQQSGQLILSQIRSSINGTLTVDRITPSGTLLKGVTLHGVGITDPEGRPFIRADSARLSYRLRTLIRGSVVFDRIVVYGPDVTLERLPGRSHWNYDVILGDTTSTPDTTAAAPSRSRTLVLIRNAAIRDGRVVVRFPWETDGGPADTTRLILESVPGGRVRTLRFEDVQVDLPRVVWQAPGSEGRLLEIENLATMGHVWDTPFDVRELDGVLTIRDSILSFETERARLPDSDLYMNGRIVLGGGENRYDIEASGSRVAFQDFQWLYPALPAEGGGSLRFRMQTQDSGRMLWLVEDADIQTLGNELEGSFGVLTGESLAFTNVDVRARPLDLAFLSRVLPDSLPLRGLVIGRLEAEGPVTAIRTRADVRYRTFDEAGNGAESDLRWDGTVGMEPPYVVRGLEAELRSLDLAQAGHFAPGFRIQGTAQGTIRGEGSLDNGLQVSGSMRMEGEAPSSIRGSGWLALGGTPTFDLQFDAEPVALELLGQQLPALAGLRGEAQGPVTVSGSLGDLTVDADLMTPAGEVVARAVLALTGPRLGYRAEGSVTEFRLDRVTDVPETEITGRFELDGSGTDLASLRAAASADVLAASVGGLEVYRGLLRGSVADGLARVDSFAIATEAGDLRAQGTLGLVEDRTGELDFTLRADSLTYLEPLLFPDAPPADLGMERVSLLEGTVNAEGRIVGSVQQWRISGTGRARALLYDQAELGRGNVEIEWDRDSLQVAASLDSLRYGSRRLASVQGRMTYVDGVGQVEADVRGRRAQELHVATSFEPQGSMVSLGLRQLELATRDGTWGLRGPVDALVGREGVRLDSLVLTRNPSSARIRVAGVLPWRQPGADEVQVASLDIDLDSVRIAEFLRVFQTDTLVDGVVTGGFQVSGTALEPRLTGEVHANRFRYGGALLDSLRVGVRYEAETLAGAVTGWQGGSAIVTGEATVPVRLALTPVTERFLDEPLDVRFLADGVPAALVSFLAPGFTDLGGRVEGRMAVVGTPREPDLRGTMQLVDGTARFEPLAVNYRDIQATARMVQGTNVELEATLETEAGRGEIQGVLDLEVPGDPGFDLTVTAQRLDAAHRRDVTAVINGQAHVGGHYSRPVVSGDIGIVEGEMNLDEIWRQYQIVQLDTTLFQMLDTTQVSYRPTPENPFLENLQVTDMNLNTRRNFWLRSRELNVEVSGGLELEVDRQTDDLRLTGTLQVVQGSYQLLARRLPSGRRFEIRQGTIEFVGTPGIDPNLDIAAAYRVRRAQGEPINVLAQVTGTLQAPRVELSSDSEIPMTETDLASYILFGRATAELSQAELDVASGGALAAGLFRPVVSSVASSELERVATSLGLPVDYVALTLPEYGMGWQQTQGVGLLRDAQIEVGFDPARNVSVIGSVRIPSSDPAEDTPSALRLFGARIQYRPWQTWTVEGYIEDQFARTPSFGPAEILDRKLLGLSFFREWGY